MVIRLRPCTIMNTPHPPPHLVFLHQQIALKCLKHFFPREHGRCPANGLPFMLGGKVPQRMFRLNMWLMAPDVVFNEVAAQVNCTPTVWEGSAGVSCCFVFSSPFRDFPRGLW